MTTAEMTSQATANSSAKALAFGMLALGGAMAVMALIARADAGPRAAEAAAGALVVIGGALLLSGRGGERAATAGGFALLGSLVYLAVTNTQFQEGGIQYSIGVAQFVSVPIALVLGATAFALTPRSVEARTKTRLSDVVPEGVILVVGTILLGIGLGQVGNERLSRPTGTGSASSA